MAERGERQELTRLDQLHEIERLAHEVVREASSEGWLTYAADEEAADATPLHRSVNALARVLGTRHFEGDGCLEVWAGEDPELVELAAAAVLGPGATEGYEEACARLGVPPRDEGWALWWTWRDGESPKDDDDRRTRVTMVVSVIATTEGVLANWAEGRELLPVMPLPSQIGAVCRGWVGPVTFAPSTAERLGLGGRPLPG